MGTSTTTMNPAGMSEEQLAVMLDQMTSNLPEGIDGAVLKAKAEEMFAHTDKNGDDTVDRDEAIAFMKEMVTTQFETMMASMPEEMKSVMTPEMIEAQKGPMLEGVEAQVDQMAADMPLPWSHNMAMMVMIGQAMGLMMAAQAGQ